MLGRSHPLSQSQLVGRVETPAVSVEPLPWKDVGPPDPGLVILPITLVRTELPQRTLLGHVLRRSGPNPPASEGWAPALGLPGI